MTRSAAVVQTDVESGRGGLFLDHPINRWWIVLGCALVNMFASGIFVLYAVNIFFVDAVAEFGWQKSTTSLLMSTFFFSAGLGFPALGWAISRYGIRKPSVLVALGYAATVLIIPALPPSQPLFLVNFFLMGIFSASACALPFSIAISGYFDRNRGLALGLGAAGAGLGSSITAGMSNLLLEAFGWRTGLWLYGCLAVAVIFFCLTFLIRTPPGTVVRDAKMRAGASQSASLLSLFDREMCIIVAVLVLNALCAMGIIGNLIPLLSNQGISTGVAASLLSAVGLSSWGGRVLIGWLLDKFFAPYVACCTFVVGAIGALLLVYGISVPMGFAGAVMIGVCMGAEQDLAMYLVSRYFPLSAYSRAVSISWVAWAWGGSIGTFIAAQSYNLTRTYESALWIFIGLFLLAGVLIMLLPPYRKELTVRN